MDGGFEMDIDIEVRQSVPTSEMIAYVSQYRVVEELSEEWWADFFLGLTLGEVIVTIIFYSRRCYCW